jgi:hypothetical protein
MICSHTRTSFTLRLSNTLPRSSPPSAPVTMYRKPTKSFGSTLHHCTKTRTKVSKAEGKIGGYPQCHRPFLPIPHPTRICRLNLCTEATLDPTNSTTATAAAAALQCLVTLATRGPSTATTLMLRSRLATKHKARATMIWSSLSARCTEHHGRTYIHRYVRTIQ